MFRKYWGVFFLIFFFTIFLFSFSDKQEISLDHWIPKKTSLFLQFRESPFNQKEKIKENFLFSKFRKFLKNSLMKSEEKKYFLKKIFFKKVSCCVFKTKSLEKSSKKSSYEFLISSHTKMSFWNWFFFKKKWKCQRKVFNRLDKRVVYYQIFLKNFREMPVSKSFYFFYSKDIVLLSSTEVLLKKSLRNIVKKNYLHQHPSRFLKKIPMKHYYCWSYFDLNMISIPFLRKLLKKSIFFEDSQSSKIAIIVKDPNFNSSIVVVEALKKLSFFDPYYRDQIINFKKNKTDPFMSLVDKETQLYYSHLFYPERLVGNISQFLSKNQFLKKTNHKILSFYQNFVSYIVPWIGNRCAIALNKNYKFLAITSIKNRAFFWMFWEGFLKKKFRASWQEFFVNGTLIAKIAIGETNNLFLMPWGDLFFAAQSLEQLKNEIKLLNGNISSLRVNAPIQHFFEKNSFSKEIEWVNFFVEDQKVPILLKNYLFLFWTFALECNKDLKKKLNSSHLKTWLNHWKKSLRILVSVKKLFHSQYFLNIFHIDINP